jgi:hypothetical protein
VDGREGKGFAPIIVSDLGTNLAGESAIFFVFPDELTYCADPLKTIPRDKSPSVIEIKVDFFMF